jgi:regulation of enolase protein 1 (concanavalin A-like superfamily)
MNLLDDLSLENLTSRALFWSHPPEKWEPLPGFGMRVYASPGVDYFQDPTGAHKKDDAPYLWVNVTGDFVAKARLRAPKSSSPGDAGAIMARLDAQHWVKLCYEYTDMGTTAAVSVVTNGTSDDANGAELSMRDAWLQVCRVGDVFAMHYSLDGLIPGGVSRSSWRMVRLVRLPMTAVSIKVGLVAQCPEGPGTTIDFLNFGIELRTVKNLRAGT